MISCYRYVVYGCMILVMRLSDSERSYDRMDTVHYMHLTDTWAEE